MQANAASNANQTKPNTTMSTNAYQIGDLATFKAYDAESLGDNEPIFQPGQRLKLIAAGKEDGSFIACLETDEKVQDTCFLDELDLKPVAEVPVATPAAAPVAKVKKTAAKKAAPAAAAPAAVVAAPVVAAPVVAAPVETAPVAVPAKPVRAPKAAKTAPAAAAPAAAPAATTETPAVISGDTEAVRAALATSHDALEAARVLVTRADETYFTLGGVLNRIAEHKDYLTITDAGNVPRYQGATAFEDYVEKDLGVKARKARYLIAIYKHFSVLGLDEKRLTTIGWAKAKEIARAGGTIKDSELLLDFATGHNIDDLKAKIEETSVSAGGDGTGTSGAKAKKVAFKFVFFQDKADTLQAALDTAKQAIDSEDPNAALDYIMTEWMSAQAGVDMPLEQMLAYVNTKYGVTVGEVEADDVQAVEVAETATATA